MTTTKRKNKSNNYFTDETEQCVIKYLASDDDEYRNKLFDSHIAYPLFKMSENLINRYGFYHIAETVEEIQQLAVIHLHSKMYAFDPTRGKAFSLFTKICFNFLVQENKKAYSRKVMKQSLSDIETDDQIFDETNNHDRIEFFDIMVNYIEHNFDQLFDRQYEQKIVDALLLLMRMKHNLNLNKKSIYLQIREITDENSANITKTVKKLKMLYSILFDIYMKEDKINLNYIPNGF